MVSDYMAIVGDALVESRGAVEMDYECLHASNSVDSIRAVVLARVEGRAGDRAAAKA